MFPRQLRVVLRMAERMGPDGGVVTQSPSGVVHVVVTFVLPMAKDQSVTVTGSTFVKRLLFHVFLATTASTVSVEEMVLLQMRKWARVTVAVTTVVLEWNAPRAMTMIAVPVPVALTEL